MNDPVFQIAAALTGVGVVVANGTRDATKDAGR